VVLSNGSQIRAETAEGRFIDEAPGAFAIVRYIYPPSNVAAFPLIVVTTDQAVFFSLG
jgi:hypothetical protein